MPARFATEVSFRLGPESATAARGIAERLAAAAAGCRLHWLFLDEEAGEYGCMALWDSAGEAATYARRPAVVQELTALASFLGKQPRVRRYTVEEQS